MAEVCEVCDCKREATRVIAGHQFCSAHRDGDLVPEVPLVLRVIVGCGSPAATRGLCNYHAGHVPPSRAA